MPVGLDRFLERRKCNISYNTGTHALPDIYALALRGCTPRALCPSGIVCIYQAKHSCLCYNCYIYRIYMWYYWGAEYLAAFKFGDKETIKILALIFS